MADLKCVVENCSYNKDCLCSKGDIDERAEKLGYRVREAQVKKIPYLIILGKQEAQDGTVSYRLHGQQNTTTVSKDEFLAMLKDEIATKKLSK